MTAAKRLEWQYKFHQYDTSGDNKLDQHELKCILTMGNPGISDAEVAKLFREVDRNNDGTIDFDEFVDFLHDTSMPFQPAPVEVKTGFKENYGDEMGHEDLVRFCRDCKLLDLRLQQRDADALFARVCPRGRKRLLYEHFDKMLSSIAHRKGVTPAQVHDQILRSRKWSKAPPHHSGLAPPGRDDSIASPRETPADVAFIEDGAIALESSVVDWDVAERTFAAFCRQGVYMDRMEFTKLCDDCWLLDSKFKKADADIVFSKVMNPQKKIDFEIFKEALQVVAERQGHSLQHIQKKVGRAKGPKLLNTTVAAATRLHGDGDSDTAEDERDTEVECNSGEEADWAWVRKTYKAFAGSSGLSGADFFKLCTDCGLLDDKFNRNDADLMFSARSRRKNDLTFEQFQEVVRDVAKKKMCPVRAVQSAVGYTMGPKFKGTVSQHVRLHDDRSAYTGTHKGK